MQFNFFLAYFWVLCVSYIEQVRVGSTDITADLERLLIRSMRGKGDNVTGNASRIFFRSRLYIPPRTNVNWSNLQYACWLDKEVMCDGRCSPVRC